MLNVIKSRSLNSRVTNMIKNNNYSPFEIVINLKREPTSELPDPTNLQRDKTPEREQTPEPINLKKEKTPEPDIKPIIPPSVQCEEVSFTCNYCDKLYFEKEQLRNHIEQHMKNNNKLKCDLCNIGFSRKTYLAEHYCIHTGEKPHSCYYCGKSFSLRCNLVRHSRIHTGEKRFGCHICKTRFILKKNLDEHIRTHTGEKPFKCKTCDRPFGRRSSLVRHVRTHTGEKDFVCHICNKNFAWKYYLQRHMSVHLNPNNRRSPENGDGAAPRKRKTADPLSPADGICGTCGKTFKTKKNLEKHAKKHEDNYIAMKNTIYGGLTPEEYKILATKELVVVCDAVPE